MEGFTGILNDIGKFFTNYGINIAVAIAVFIIGYFLIKLLSKGLMLIVYSTKIDNAVGGFVVSIIRLALFIFLLFGVASILGIEGNSFLVGLSSVAVAVALALKDSLSNVANGIMIIITKPFQKGDHVCINGVDGLIKAIRVLNTEIVTFDNKKIVVPNNSVVLGNIINYTANPTRRLEFTFSVGYASDMKKVKQVIIETISKFDFIHSSPAPLVFMKAQAASSVDFELRVWVNTGDYWTSIGKINESVFEAFRENDIEIPFQQIDMHFRDQLVVKAEDKNDKEKV